MVGIIDVHCHILPGVDDGAQTLEESKKMLELEYQEGVRTVFATPHFRRRMFESSMEKIEQQYQKVKEIACGIGDGMDVFLACEYHVNMEIVEDLNSKVRPTVAGSSYVLAEFSGNSDFSFMRERAYDLISNGYRPIFAHVERYRCLGEKIERVEELARLGAYMQVNAGSIIGEDGWKVKRFCKKMMQEDLLHFVGTDGHGMKYRVPHIAQCAQYMEKKMGQAYTKKILIENPSEIIKTQQEGIGENNGTDTE